MTLYTSKEMIFSPDDLPAPWRRAESVICDKYDLEEDHGSYYDAREADGTPVEIKSCVARYANGRIGQFEIWDSQLWELFHHGKFALLVHKSWGSHPIVATRMIHAGALVGVGTHDRSRHPTMGYEKRHRIKWPDVISLDEIHFWFRRSYLDQYDEAEIEDTILPAPYDRE
jgi:hypothetical protein